MDWQFKKGNTLWQLRSKHGRDQLFENPELLREAACEFFSHIDNTPWQKSEQLKTPIKKKNDKGDIEVTSIIQVPTARPYTLSGFCLYVGASESWWRNFRIKEGLSDDFLTVIHWIETVIETQQFEGATVGAFNANIISRKQGLSEKSEMTGKDGGPIQHDHKFKITLNLNK